MNAHCSFTKINQANKMEFVINWSFEGIFHLLKIGLCHLSENREMKPRASGD